MSLEKMEDFFTARVDTYDEHMLTNVEGCKEGYLEMARLLPPNARTLLDLGCGTGLELTAIFEKCPDIRVTGIDLTQAMLDRLREKFPDKQIRLICGSYFDTDLGREAFDTAISFQTMHHFSHEEKIGLYARIHAALKPYGQYIECDYMMTEQADEDFHYAENRRIRQALGIAEDAFYHYDTPCTVENQRMLLTRAGFDTAKSVWREECTTILVATKATR